jgi:hypothetical protein
MVRNSMDKRTFNNKIFEEETNPRGLGLTQATQTSKTSSHPNTQSTNSNQRETRYLLERVDPIPS